MKAPIPGWVYILKCADKSYYIGSTTNLVKRMNEHINGTLNGFTSKRLPVDLVYSESFDNMKEALKREYQLKSWTRKKKEALIEGKFKLLHELAKCENETSHSNSRKERE